MIVFILSREAGTLQKESTLRINTTLKYNKIYSEAICSTLHSTTINNSPMKAGYILIRTHQADIVTIKHSLGLTKWA